MTKKEIIKLIKPGDVILLEGTAESHQFFTKFLHFMIRWYQRRLFGKNSNYKDTHAMLYIFPGFIFSMDFPVGKWECLDTVLSQRFTVYRGTKAEYVDFWRELYEIASRIVHRPYDVGDLLDFLISGILGYTDVRRIRFFEFSRRYTTCSVAVRTIFERLRKNQELDGNYFIPRLFEGVDVEMTTPAHFANSDKYDFEFRKIVSWKELDEDLDG